MRITVTILSTTLLLVLFSCASILAIIQPAFSADENESLENADEDRSNNDDGRTDSAVGVDDEDIDAGEIEVEADKSPSIESLPGQDYAFVYFDDMNAETGGIARVLDRIAGLDIHWSGGASDLALLSIRGAAPYQTSVSLNGIPLSSDTSGMFDLSLLPAGAIKSALVERGAGASDGFAGGIDLRVRNAEHPAFSITYGSFGSGFARISLPFTLVGSTGTLYVSRNLTEGDFTYSRRDGTVFSRDNNERKLSTLALFLENGDDSIKRNLTFTFASKSGGVPGMSEFPTPDAHQSDVVAQAGFGYIQSEIWDGEFRANLYTRVSKLQFTDPEPFFGSAIETKQTEFDGGVSVGYRHSGGDSITGIGLSLDACKLEDRDYGNPTRTSGSIRAWKEFYMEDLTLSTALGIGIDSDGESGWKGNAAFVYDLGSDFSLEGSAARSFRRPNFSELYYPESGYIGGNPELDNETGTFFDLGLRYSTDSAALSIRGFNQRFDESIQFVPVTLYSIRAENTGAVRIRGATAEMTLELNDRINVSTALSSIDAEYLDGGIPMAGRTPLKYSLSIAGDFDDYEWKVGWLHENSTPVDRFGSLYAPASDDLTCAIRCKLGKAIAIRLSGANLLDDDLRDSLDFPIPGRNFEVGIEYTW